jgi:hypothetical protein
MSRLKGSGTHKCCVACRAGAGKLTGQSWSSARLPSTTYCVHTVYTVFVLYRVFVLVRCTEYSVRIADADADVGPSRLSGRVGHGTKTMWCDGQFVGLIHWTEYIQVHSRVPHTVVHSTP